jgi:predicted kinase
MEDLRDGKKLLNILKPKTGSAPAFGDIPFDILIFDALTTGSTGSTTASTEPKILILCGPPGCGKSTVKTDLLAQNSINTYINIDPDEIRTILMKNGVTFPADKTTMPGITNAFNKRMSDEAQRRHLNIVFDTTGQNFRAVSDIIYTSNQLGYKSVFSIIWASLETCRKRVESRNQYLKDSHSGRIELPLEVAEGIYNGFISRPRGTASMLLLDYPVKADEVFLYNNNVDGAPPALLYHKVGTTVEKSTDFPGFYNMNLSDKEPYISLMTSGGKRSDGKKRSKKRSDGKKRSKKRSNKRTNKRRFR